MKTNYEVRYAAHPDDVKHYDTARIREHYHIPTVFRADEINMVYSMHDRIIAGGAQPVNELLELETIDILRMPFFLSRREMGIFNVGGEGVVIVDNKTYNLAYKEALYLGRGDRKVQFKSVDATHPAKFYFNSTPAHTTHPDKHITKKNAIVVDMGTPEESNKRTINKMIVNQVLPTCELQMGMTELKPGSTWNTMPAHTHNRRMEVYFYFEVPAEQAVCHFMGQPDETRHIWMKGEQAVISPEWSIHSACATSNYTFIWGMSGENLDYGDMDLLATTDLK
ncbi:MAG: 5-dehydro-4-deoxy-D-glucuronate isomerase [Alistipes sp.]